MPGFSTARSDNGCNAMPMTRVRMRGGIHTAPKRRKFCLSATKATAAMTAHSATPGATRRRLSGAQRRTISTATALLRIKNGDELAFADRLAFADLDFPDDAGLGREHGDFHLHRFEDHDLAFDLDPVAGLGLDLPDVARDLRLHIDDGHAPFISRSCAQGLFSATASANARAERPGRPPSRYAASFTSETKPSSRVERPSPMRADMVDTVAPAMPARSRMARPATPACSMPKPASLNSASRGPNAAAVSPAGTPPWLPLATTQPRSRTVASEIESTHRMRPAIMRPSDSGAGSGCGHGAVFSRSAASATLWPGSTPQAAASGLARLMTPRCSMSA